MPRHWSRWLVTSGGPMLSREIGGRRPAGQAVDGKRDEEIGGGADFGGPATGSPAVSRSRYTGGEAC
jgi:hypothetical protein